MASVPGVRRVRGVVLPFAVAFYPQLWFVNREVGIALATTDESAAVIHRQAIGSAGLALVVSLLVGMVVAGALWRSSAARRGWLRVLLRPSDVTIAVFGAVSFAFWSFVFLHSPSTLPPGWSDAIGLVFAWPLLVLYAGMVVLGNAFLGEPSMPVQSALVGVGVSLSAVWMFLASGWLAPRVLPGDSGVETG